MSRRRIVNMKNNQEEYYSVKGSGNIFKAYGKQAYDQDNQDPIFLITQFFIPKDEERYKEIKECLKRNVQNPLIKKIYLMNEKNYTQSELGISSDKIEQINQEKRMSYLDAIKLIRKEKEKAYYVISNSDIFFDSSLNELTKSRMHIEPIIQSLIRYEFRGQDNLEDCPLFTKGLQDAQDTWILHSNFLSLLDKDKEYDIHLGIPGCDQSINHRFHISNFKIFNDPSVFKTYHYHKSDFREYRKNNVPPTKKPYLYLKPKIK